MDGWMDGWMGHMGIYIYIYTHTYACTHANIHIRIQIHPHIHICIHTHMCIYVCIYIYIYMLTPPPPMIQPSLLFVSSGSWEVGNLRCANIDKDQISKKFLKPEMRKHWQGSNFPKIFKILASMGSAVAIVAQILGILGKFDPCQCFRL